MQIDVGVNLKPYNTFGLPAVAKTLVRITSDADVRRVVDDKALGRAPKFIPGGGSNIILTRDMPQVVLKVEVRGMRLVEEPIQLRAVPWEPHVHPAAERGDDRDHVAQAQRIRAPGLQE